MQEQGDCLLLPPLHFHGVALQAIISSLLCLIPELLQELQREDGLKLAVGSQLGKHEMRQIYCSNLRILFQGFGVLARHFKMKGVWQVNPFAKACHQIPVDVARVHSMGSTFGQQHKLIMLCPILKCAFCQPSHGPS